MLTFRNLTLKQINEFRFQVRPCHRVVFQNVALEPKTADVPADSPTPENARFVFGPTTTRELLTGDANEQGYVFFNFKTGKAFKSPFPLKETPKSVPAAIAEDRYSWIGRSKESPKSDPNAMVEYTPELIDWIEANGVDILFFFIKRDG